MLASGAGDSAGAWSADLEKISCTASMICGVGLCAESGRISSGVSNSGAAALRSSSEPIAGRAAGFVFERRFAGVFFFAAFVGLAVIRFTERTRRGFFAEVFTALAFAGAALNFNRFAS